MTYRDDLEAALKRAEAAERKAKELEEKLNPPKPDVPKPKLLMSIRWLKLWEDFKYYLPGIMFVLLIISLASGLIFTITKEEHEPLHSCIIKPHPIGAGLHSSKFDVVAHYEKWRDDFELKKDITIEEANTFVKEVQCPKIVRQ